MMTMMIAPHDGAMPTLDNAQNSPMRSMVRFAPAGQTKLLEISRWLLNLEERHGSDHAG
jgi:hypothetical protein